MTTVVGLFSTIAEAERVATELNALGVPDQDVNVLAGNGNGQHASHMQSVNAEGNNAAAGAGSGAAIGGGIGLVAGLVALAIPGVGPVIAGGALATALTGLGVGAAAGGLIGAFAEMGVPEDEASVYEEGIRRGGVVVSARVPDSLESEAARLMDRHGARDMSEESDAWRASGWDGAGMGGMVYDPILQPMGFMPAMPIPDFREDYRPRARSYPLQNPASERTSSSKTMPSNENDKNRKDVNMDATPKHQATSPLDLSAIPDDGKNDNFPHRTEPHHLSNDPAWIFGNRWASDPNYAGKGWSDVESGLRSSWESAHAGPWDSFREKIRSGYENSDGESEDPLAAVDLNSKSGQRGY